MSEHRERVVIIEDEPAIRRFLKASLTAHGYDVLEAENAREGMMHVTTSHPDAVVLDLGLPDRDGMELIREIRGWSKVPIIVLSARGQEQSKIAALDEGADDYLTKPFSAGELLARIRVSLRHARREGAPTGASELQTGKLKLDLTRRRVTLAGQELHLTPTEYLLLTVLMKNVGKVVTHRQILREVWGPSAERESHYVRVYMGHLRRKIEPDPAQPTLLLNEPGVGYRLADLPPEPS